MHEQIAQTLGLWMQEKGPMYQRLANGLRRAIGTAQIPAASRLPAERVLAQMVGVSRNTVVAAYRELEADGWIERKAGSGTWVCRLSGQNFAQLRATQTSILARGMVYDAFLADHVDPIDLATGAVAWPVEMPVQPYLPTAQELAPLVKEYGYLPQGYLPLRLAIARYFAQRGAPTSADQILVTTGAQQAIQLLATYLLHRGETILLETPTFFGALDAFRSLDLHLCAIPVAQDGLHMTHLHQQLVAGRARWFYLQPTLQNPTGTDLSTIQRHTLVQLAKQYGVTLIEDLTMADLRWAAPPLEPLATLAPHGEIISLGSLSKTVWGGTRIGWMRASAEIIARLARCKLIQDLGSPVLSQVAATHLLDDLPLFLTPRHQELRRSLACMEAYLLNHLPTWTWQRPGGGLFLWIQLSAGDAREFAQDALRHGVLVTPGPSLSVHAEHIRYIRLSYICPPEILTIGLERLEQAWRHYETRLDAGDNSIPVLL